MQPLDSLIGASSHWLGEMREKTDRPKSDAVANIDVDVVNKVFGLESKKLIAILYPKSV